MRGVLRLGLAGLGRHGMRYAGHLLRGEIPGAELSAVCRRDDSRGASWAKANGVAYCSGADELIGDPGVDALVIVLPPLIQARVLRRALEAGIPTLVEKPAAADSETARDLLELQRRRPTPVMVAQTLRFDSTVVTVRRELQRVGSLRLLTFSQRFEPTDREWIDDPREGGLLLNTGVHGCDLLQWIAGGSIAEARLMASRHHTRRTDDTFAAVMRIEPGGTIAVLDNSRATEARSARLEVVGARGQLAADLSRGIVRFLSGGESRELQVPPRVPTCREALRSFVAAVRRGVEPPVTLADGVRAVEAVDLLRGSGSSPSDREP